MNCRALQLACLPEWSSTCILHVTHMGQQSINSTNMHLMLTIRTNNSFGLPGIAELYNLPVYQSGPVPVLSPTSLPLRTGVLFLNYFFNRFLYFLFFKMYRAVLNPAVFTHPKLVSVSPYILSWSSTKSWSQLYFPKKAVQQSGKDRGLIKE